MKQLIFALMLIMSISVKAQTTSQRLTAIEASNKTIIANQSTQTEQIKALQTLTDLLQKKINKSDSTAGLYVDPNGFNVYKNAKGDSIIISLKPIKN